MVFRSFTDKINKGNKYIPLPFLFYIYILQFLNSKLQITYVFRYLFNLLVSFLHISVKTKITNMFRYFFNFPVTFLSKQVIKYIPLPFQLSWNFFTHFCQNQGYNLFRYLLKFPNPFSLRYTTISRRIAK